MAAILKYVVRLSIFAVVGVLVYLFLRPRYLFTVKIRNGKVTSSSGRICESFVTECDSIAGRFDIKRGTIRAVAKSGRVSLSFSKDIPKFHHQRFRNVYHNSC